MKFRSLGSMFGNLSGTVRDDLEIQRTLNRKQSSYADICLFLGANFEAYQTARKHGEAYEPTAKQIRANILDGILDFLAENDSQALYKKTDSKSITEVPDHFTGSLDEKVELFFQMTTPTKYHLERQALKRGIPNPGKAERRYLELFPQFVVHESSPVQQLLASIGITHYDIKQHARGKLGRINQKLSGIYTQMRTDPSPELFPQFYQEIQELDQLRKTGFVDQETITDRDWNRILFNYTADKLRAIKSLLDDPHTPFSPENYNLFTNTGIDFYTQLKSAFRHSREYLTDDEKEHTGKFLKHLDLLMKKGRKDQARLVKQRQADFLDAAEKAAEEGNPNYQIYLDRFVDTTTECSRILGEPRREINLMHLEYQAGDAIRKEIRSGFAWNQPQTQQELDDRILRNPYLRFLNPPSVNAATVRNIRDTYRKATQRKHVTELVEVLEELKDTMVEYDLRTPSEIL